MRSILIIFIILFFCGNAFSWSPPGGSPMMNGDHPRILFITDAHRSANSTAPGATVTEMRTQLINANYSATFASWITIVEAEYVKTISTLSKLDITMNAINFAFLYKLDPDNWSGSGFTFGYTTAQYGAKAKAYGDYMSIQMAAVTGTDPLKQNWSDYKTFDYGGGDEVGDGLANVSLAIVADWCYPLLSLSDKQAYMDGFIAVYDYAGNIDDQVWTAASHVGRSQNIGGVLAFYGEGSTIDDGAGTIYTDALTGMGTKLDTDWIVAVNSLGDLIFGGGSNSVEGNSYTEVTDSNMAPFMHAISTSLNEDFFQTTGYWNKKHLYKLYIMKPLDFDSVWHSFTTDDNGDEAGQTNMEYGKNILWWYPTIAHLTGDDASVARWTKETYFAENDSIKLLWRGVLSYFFNGYEEVVPKSPSTVSLPLSKNVGMGQYVLRSNWGNKTDTLISFYAPSWRLNEGGHAHQDFGAFRIFKHGNLTEDRQIAKTYPSQPVNSLQTQRSMFRNTIGVLKPDEIDGNGFNTMGYKSFASCDRNATSPTDPAFQTGGANDIGVVISDDLNDIHYDYIDYDYSNSWDDIKVDYAEREFIYLRSEGGTNDEYVLVYDRINAVDSTYKKYFLLQSMYEPTVNDAGTATSEKYPLADSDDGGRWIFPTSSINSTVEMTNEYDVSHGKLFNRTILPSTFQINKVGGSTHYWEDANGKNIEPIASLTDYITNCYGSYAIQVQPGVSATYDKFLNVMQIGSSSIADSSTILTAMTDMVGITGTTGSTGNLTGAHIKDSTKNRIVLFNDQNRNTVATQTAPYAYTATVTASSFHLLTNIEPSTIYSVSDGSTVISTPTSSSDGILSFEDTTNTTGSITYTITASLAETVYAGVDQAVSIDSATISGTYANIDPVTSCTWSNDRTGSGTLTATGGTITGTVIGLSSGINVITILVNGLYSDTVSITYTPQEASGSITISPTGTTQTINPAGTQVTIGN